MALWGATWLVDPALAFRLMSYGSMALLVLSVLVMVRTYKVARKVSRWALSLSIVTALVSLMVNSALRADQLEATGVDVDEIVAVGLSLGLIVGLVWSLTNRLRYEDGAVRSRGNLWYLLIWGLTFAIFQFVTMSSERPPELGVAMLAGSTGLVLASNASLILRSFFVQWAGARRRKRAAR